MNASHRAHRPRASRMRSGLSARGSRRPSAPAAPTSPRRRSASPRHSTTQHPRGEPQHLRGNEGLRGGAGRHLASPRSSQSATPEAIKTGVLTNIAGLNIGWSNRVPVVAGSPNSTKNIALAPGAMILAMRNLPTDSNTMGARQTVMVDQDPPSIRVTMAYNPLGTQVTRRPLRVAESRDAWYHRPLVRAVDTRRSSHRRRPLEVAPAAVLDQKQPTAVGNPRMTAGPGREGRGSRHRSPGPDAIGPRARPQRGGGRRARQPAAPKPRDLHRSAHHARKTAHPLAGLDAPTSAPSTRAEHRPASPSRLEPSVYLIHPVKGPSCTSSHQAIADGALGWADALIDDIRRARPHPVAVAPVSGRLAPALVATPTSPSSATARR